MRTFGIMVVGFVLIVVVVLVVPWPLTLINRQYFGWRHMSAKYYADFTAACDSVLATHPLGTNDFIQIPVTDPSLPKIITDAKPLKIKISRQRFWMLQGSDSHAGIGVTWEPQWGHTNVWILLTTAESLDTVVYTRIKWY
jgi:hypothetical protein